MLLLFVVLKQIIVEVYAIDNLLYEANQEIKQMYNHDVELQSLNGIEIEIMIMIVTTIR